MGNDQNSAIHLGRTYHLPSVGRWTPEIIGGCRAVGCTITAHQPLKPILRGVILQQILPLVSGSIEFPQNPLGVGLVIQLDPTCKAKAGIAGGK